MKSLSFKKNNFSTKKIVVICTNMSPINHWMSPHMKALKEYGYVDIISTEASSRVSRELKNVINKTIDIEIPRKISLIKDILCLFKITFILKNNKYDFLLVTMPKSSFIGLLSGFLCRIKNRVYICQGEVWAGKKGFINFITKTLDKVTHYLSTSTVVMSKHQKKFLLENDISTNDKLNVLGEGSICGVDLKNWQFSKEKRRQMKKNLNLNQKQFVFGYIGRINNDKGVDDLVKAFCSDENIYTKSYLLIVGPNEDNTYEKIHFYIKNFKNIIYINKFVSNPIKYYSCMDLICLPSRRESFGMSLAEGAALGIPSLSSNIYGLKSVVLENKTGICHNFGDIKQIKEKMIYCLNNKGRVLLLGKNAKNHIQTNFSKEKIIEEYKKYFKSQIFI